MDGVGGTVAAIATGVVGLAIVSVLVSKQAQTASVITSAFSGLSSVVGAAVSPVTGSNASNTTSSGIASFFGGSSVSGSNSMSGLPGGGIGGGFGSLLGGIGGSTGGGGMNISDLGSLASLATAFV